MTTLRNHSFYEWREKGNDPVLAIRVGHATPAAASMAVGCVVCAGRGLHICWPRPASPVDVASQPTPASHVAVASQHVMQFVTQIRDAASPVKKFFSTPSGDWPPVPGHPPEELLPQGAQ